MPHASPLVTVRWETMGFIRGMVSQLFSTGCRVEAESSVPYKMPLFFTYGLLFMNLAEQLKYLSLNTNAEV